LILVVDSGHLGHCGSNYHNFLMAASQKLAQTLNHPALPAERNEIIVRVLGPTAKHMSTSIRNAGSAADRRISEIE